MKGPITEKELGLEGIFEKFERLANALEEVNKLCEEIKEEEEIKIKFKVELG